MDGQGVSARTFTWTALLAALAPPVQQVLAPTKPVASRRADGAATVVYANDFQTAAGTEWSHRRIDTTPKAGRKFLGQFGNDTVTLTLKSLGRHKCVRLSFDLYACRTWDGTPTAPQHDPDIWTLRVVGGPRLLHTTFSNCEFVADIGKQAYPGEFPGDKCPGRTGAAEKDTLGYTWNFQTVGLRTADAVYKLRFTFGHTGESLRVRFSASGLQELADESWGLDNVRVELLRDVDAAGLDARTFRRLWSDLGEAKLTMRVFSTAFRDVYLARAGRDVLSSVGCYQIEGLGVTLFERIEGDHFTILGMPLLPLLRELRALEALPT